MLRYSFKHKKIQIVIKQKRKWSTIEEDGHNASITTRASQQEKRKQSGHPLEKMVIMLASQQENRRQNGQPMEKIVTMLASYQEQHNKKTENNVGNH